MIMTLGCRRVHGVETITRSHFRTAGKHGVRGSLILTMPHDGESIEYSSQSSIVKRQWFSRVREWKSLPTIVQTLCVA